MVRLHDERNLSELFEALLEHSADAILLTRPDGAILRANPAACRALGRTEDEVKALGRAGLVVPTPELAVLLREREQTGKTRGEVLLRKPDGTVFPAEVTSTVIPLSAGKPVTLIVFRDVTERNQRDEELRASLHALRESEERFRAAFQTLPDGITISELDTGLVLEMNEGSTRVTGWTPVEMVGRTSLELGLWHDGDRASLLDAVRANGSAQDARTRLRRKDGTIIDVSLSARLVVASGRKLLLTITRDISAEIAEQRAREALEAQLLHSHKMEAIGRLAGGVAHDLNNLLTVIFSCGEALEEDVRGGVTASLDDLKEIRMAAERARDLTRQLLAFARRQVIHPVPLDVNEVIRGCEKLLRRVIGEDVKLIVDLQAAPWPVRCDRAQLEQVVMNLAVNARDALPDGGTLRLETANVELDERAVARFVGAAPGRYVRIAVQDDGHGMTAEVRQRVFEPFFTTKEKGKGTGLGLPVVHGIVAQSGGSMSLESEPGRGTRLEIIFPPIPETPSAEEGATTPGVLCGTETILLVEDEAAVREATARSLRKAGYRVLAAANGREAVQLATSEPKLHLLLCDVLMPDQNGPDVRDAVRTVCPALRTLFVSGYPDDVIQQRGVLQPGIEFLPKPFTTTALLTRVRQVIEAR